MPKGSIPLIAARSVVVAVFSLLTALGPLPLWINALFPVVAVVRPAGRPAVTGGARPRSGGQ